MCHNPLPGNGVLRAKRAGADFAEGVDFGHALQIGLAHGLVDGGNFLADPNGPEQTLGFSFVDREGATEA